MKVELQEMKSEDGIDSIPFLNFPRNDPTWEYIAAMYREDQNFQTSLYTLVESLLKFVFLSSN